VKVIIHKLPDRPGADLPPSSEVVFASGIAVTGMGCNSSREISPGPPVGLRPQPQSSRSPQARQSRTENVSSNVPSTISRPRGGEERYDILPHTSTERAGFAKGTTVHQLASPPPPIAPSERTGSFSTQPPGWPKIIKVEGHPLDVFVLSHSRWSPGTGTCPCWSYISSGLRAVNQPEIVLTLRQRPTEDIEDFSFAPVDWVRMLYEAAKNDHAHVDAQQMVEMFFQDPVKIKFGETVCQGSLNVWQDFHKLGMLIHVENHGEVDDLPPLPYPSHHVIAFTQNEAAVAREFGCHRVMGRLVIDTSNFPIPPWIDRDGKDVTRMVDNAGTFLVNTPLPRARIHGLSAIIANDRDLVLRVPADTEKRRAFQEHWARKLPTDGGVSFESFIPWNADGMLSWKTGNKGRQTLLKCRHSKSECTSLAFLVIALLEKDSCGRLEDGYALLVTQPTLDSLTTAVAAGRDFDVKVYDESDSTERTFCLRWQREEMVREPFEWRQGAMI